MPPCCHANTNACRLDPSSSQHGAYVDEGGVFHYQHIDAGSSTVTTLLRFELQFRAAEAAQYEPVGKPWAFEFVPGAPGDLLLVQEGSCRILYASLPKQGTDSSDVFLFGSHTGELRDGHWQWHWHWHWQLHQQLLARPWRGRRQQLGAHGDIAWWQVAAVLLCTRPTCSGHPALHLPSPPLVLCVSYTALSLRAAPAAPVRCISTNGNLLLSGCQDGGLKLWRLSDGQLADAVTLPDGASITAITTLGPLLVSAGDHCPCMLHTQHMVAPWVVGNLAQTLNQETVEPQQQSSSRH